VAKELPYFRFTCQEWDSGDISLENDSIKGAFVSICSYYWLKNCSVLYQKLLKKFPKKTNKIKKLIESEIIKREGDYIIVDFLDEQLAELEEKSTKLSKAGKKGVEARKQKREARLKQGLSNKEKENYNDNDNDNYNKGVFPFEDFWKMYKKSVDKKKCQSKYSKLSDKDKLAIKEKLPAYVESTPDKQYRKGPLVYLNGNCWENEVINQNNGANNGISQSSTQKINEKYADIR